MNENKQTWINNKNKHEWIAEIIEPIVISCGFLVGRKEIVFHSRQFANFGKQKINVEEYLLKHRFTKDQLVNNIFKF